MVKLKQYLKRREKKRVSGAGDATTSDVVTAPLTRNSKEAVKYSEVRRTKLTLKSCHCDEKLQSHSCQVEKISKMDDPFGVENKQ